jgi:hypothetical protein
MCVVSLGPPSTLILVLLFENIPIYQVSLGVQLFVRLWISHRSQMISIVFPRNSHILIDQETNS